MDVKKIFFVCFFLGAACCVVNGHGPENREKMLMDVINSFVCNKIVCKTNGTKTMCYLTDVPNCGKSTQDVNVNDTEFIEHDIARERQVDDVPISTTFDMPPSSQSSPQSSPPVYSPDFGGDSPNRSPKFVPRRIYVPPPRNINSWPQYLPHRFRDTPSSFMSALKETISIIKQMRFMHNIDNDGETFWIENTNKRN